MRQLQGIPDNRLTVTISELAATLGLDRSTIWRRVKAGEIPSVRVGSTHLVPRSWLESLLEAAQ